MPVLGPSGRVRPHISTDQFLSPLGDELSANSSPSRWVCSESTRGESYGSHATLLPDEVWPSLCAPMVTCTESRRRGDPLRQERAPLVRAAAIAPWLIMAMSVRAKYVHTNLIARDWKRLVRFYIDVFGCEPRGPERDLSGSWLDRLTSLRNAHLRGIHLTLPGYSE